MAKRKPKVVKTTKQGKLLKSPDGLFYLGESEIPLAPSEVDRILYGRQ